MSIMAMEGDTGKGISGYCLNNRMPGCPYRSRCREVSHEREGLVGTFVSSSSGMFLLSFDTAWQANRWVLRSIDNFSEKLSL